MKYRSGTLFLVIAVVVQLTVSACARMTLDRIEALSEDSATKSSSLTLDPAENTDPFPSRYMPIPSSAIAIVGATAYTGTGELIENAVVLMRNGKIEAIGAGLRPPDRYPIVAAEDKWLTPGLIDSHSHLGVFGAPSVSANADGSEITNPNTANVWAEHSLWPQDPNFNRVRTGGVTTLLILPGSANVFGGRTVTVKNVPARTMQEMKFPGAPYGLKMACGENPKRIHGEKGRAPSTRMASAALIREAWIDAAYYARLWDSYHRKQATGDHADPPKRDLALDTLAGVLRGDILVHNHCYRADDMAVMIDISREFGYKISGFHHASEAYKIPDLLASRDICAMSWAGFWGGKMESYDGIEENIALVHSAGGCAIVHSDDPSIAQRLNQEAASALMAARRAGLDISKAEAIKWITAHPAKALGVLDHTGTLEPGKMADVVLWNADPFSVYAKAEKVWIDGALVFDSKDAQFRARSDFELGQKALEEMDPTGAFEE